MSRGPNTKQAHPGAQSLSRGVGGMEDLIRATSEPAGSRRLPPPAEQPPDFEKLKHVVAQYGCEVLV